MREHKTHTNARMQEQLTHTNASRVEACLDRFLAHYGMGKPIPYKGVALTC